MQIMTWFKAEIFINIFMFMFYIIKSFLKNPLVSGLEPKVSSTLHL